MDEHCTVVAARSRILKEYDDFKKDILKSGHKIKIVVETKVMRMT